MKPESDTKMEEPAGSAESEAVSPPDDSPESVKERELDDLRRFRVRTVPPDMRRQWILAETPVVSTLELQDTAPPNKSRMSPPPDPLFEAPQPLHTSPRVSSTAKTRRLPRMVPRRGPSTTILVLSIGGVVVGAACLWLSLRAPTSAPSTPSGAAAPSAVTEVDPRALRSSESAQPAGEGDLGTKAQATVPPQTGTVAAPSRSAPQAPESTRGPTSKATRSSSERDHKDPHASVAASGKMPQADKPRSEGDIKSPLFGQ